MFPFLIQPKLYEQPIWLSKEEKEAPLQVIERFFEDYKLNELRYYLWQMVEACLTSDNSQFAEPVQRADLLFHDQALEKSWRLHMPWRGKGKQTSKTAYYCACSKAERHSIAQ